MSLIIYILQDQAGQGEAENAGYMGCGAIDLSFVEHIAGFVTGVMLPKIGQDFRAPDTQKLPSRQAA